MIRITVNAGQDRDTRINELYDAVREETRVWSMDDLRRTKYLKLVHKGRGFKGTVRRVKSDNPASIQFECKAKGADFEAITAGRFVHLVLRYIPAVSEISIERKGR
jgi:hypothetical protein